MSDALKIGKKIELLMISKQLMVESHASSMEGDNSDATDGFGFGETQDIWDQDLWVDLFYEMTLCRDDCFSSEEIENLKV